MGETEELADEVKHFIVQGLACFQAPSEVVAVVKDEYGLTVNQRDKLPNALNGSVGNWWRTVPVGQNASLAADVIGPMPDLDDKIGCAQKRIVLVPSTRFHSSSPFAKNIPLGVSGKSAASFRVSRLVKRGVSRSSRTWRRGAVAARHRSILFQSADERCFADGQAVWSWRPKAGAKVAGLNESDDRR